MSEVAFACNQRDEVRDLHNVSAALCAQPGMKQQTFIAKDVQCLTPWDTQQSRVFTEDGVSATLAGADGGGQAGQGYPCAVYSFDSLSSNSMKSANPKSGCRAVEIAKCIDTTYPDPSKNQGGIAIVQEVGVEKAAAGFKELNGAKAYGNAYEEEKAPTLTSGKIDASVVIALQANGIDRADTAGCNGCGWRENESYTLNTIDRHAVCYGIDHVITTGGNCPTHRRYIIRRLTPTEAARLQGLPDNWGQLAPYDPADAEFWEDVRKTHAEINGKKYKPVKDIKKWYDKLHNDGAEYKAYGNGLALPCAEYVIHGIAEQGAKTLGSLFDGIGGFPLAGVMNGITPLWASEVEPYPIVVTKSRFKEVHNGK